MLEFMLLELKIPDKNKLRLDKPIEIQGPDGQDVPKDLLLTKEGFPFLWINPIASDNSFVEKDQTLFQIWAHNSGQNIALVGITKALKKGKFHIHDLLYETDNVWNEGDLLGFINTYKPKTKKFLKCENIIYFKKSHKSFFNVKKVLNGEYVFSEIRKNYFKDSDLFNVSEYDYFIPNLKKYNFISSSILDRPHTEIVQKINADLISNFRVLYSKNKIKFIALFDYNLILIINKSTRKLKTKKQFTLVKFDDLEFLKIKKSEIKTYFLSTIYNFFVLTQNLTFFQSKKNFNISNISYYKLQSKKINPKLPQPKIIKTLYTLFGLIKPNSIYFKGDMLFEIKKLIWNLIQ